MKPCKKNTRRSTRRIIYQLSILFILFQVYYFFVRTEPTLLNEDEKLDSKRPSIQANLKAQKVKDERNIEWKRVDKAGKRVANMIERDKNEPIGSQECGAKWATNWKEVRKKKPRVVLDGKRFLYPILVNGPNNQLIGLRDSMYLAIRLNRTLIIPQFFKHKTDTSVEKRSSSSIPAWQRVDVAAVGSLLSVVPFEDLKSLCPDGFDDFYFTSYRSSISPLRDTPFSSQVNRPPEKIYPRNMETSFTSRTIKSDKKSLLSMYGSPGQCAVYAYPFRTVGTKENSQTLRKILKGYFEGHRMKPSVKSINPDSLSDSELYSLIVHNTHKPRFVQDMVEQFLTSLSVDNLSFVSAHWRYDPVDWQVRCNHEERLRSKGKDLIIEMCNKVRSIKPVDIANAFIRAIRDTEALSNATINAVYFAAPLTMEKFISDMKSELVSLIEKEKLNSVQIFTQLDLRKHLERFSDCDTLKDNFDDIFSQLEMGICSKAAAFYRSPSSSWSQVICEVRLVDSLDKYDGNMFHMAWKAASARINA